MSEKKIYNFRFDVIESWKASFEAESDQEAARLMQQVIDGDINGNDLPGYTESNKGIDTDYESYGLEDAAGNRIIVQKEEEPND